MNEYDFLIEYKKDRSRLNGAKVVLRKGISEKEINLILDAVGINIPQELISFYKFSYGAELGEYAILDIHEIAQLMSRLKAIYGNTYKNSILPFAYLNGVGDFVSFNINNSNSDGLLILDCFHELPPDQWKEIGFGLANWLKHMTQSDFQAYWLK